MSKTRQNSAKVNINLHMSAKSCTFAAEMIENMTIEQMTHTASRCWHSQYVNPGNKERILRCTLLHQECREEECMSCPHWHASMAADLYFTGRLRGQHKETMTQIFQERMKKGTF